MASGKPVRFEVRTTSDSHFSWVRTRLSLERTLMSWVRTGTALIGFGFTIVSFFDQLKKMGPEPDLPVLLSQVNLSRFLGQGLILVGILALAIATWQYEIMIRYLWSDDFEAIRGIVGHRKRTPLVAVAIALIVIGVFALVAVNLRLR